MNIRHKDDIAVVSVGNQQSTLGKWGGVFDELDRLDCPAVIDARSVGGEMSEIDAFLLALKANEMSQLRRHRVAIVAGAELPTDVAFFIVSSKNLGLAIESFDSIETAAAWASSHDPQSLQGRVATC